MAISDAELSELRRVAAVAEAAAAAAQVRYDALIKIVANNAADPVAAAAARQTANDFNTNVLIPARNAAAAADTAVINAERQRDGLPVVQPTEANSAAQTVNDDAAKGPTAQPQQELTAAGRVVTKPDTTTPSTAEVPATTDSGGGDQNTNPEKTVTAEQSQATTSKTGPIPVLKVGQYDTATGRRLTDAEVQGLFTTKPPATVLKAGVAAGGDDAANKSVATNYKDVDIAFNASKIVKPQPNILDRFSSYTYQASVYLMTPGQYENLLATKKKTINGFQLLFQSGGAPASRGNYDVAAQAAGGAAAAQVGRSSAFPNDFYIDSITLENALLGKSTGAAHMAASLKFTVVEPNGITLIDRLYQAAQDNAPKGATGKINYQAAAYLMVIRFFGYDESGKLQQVGAVGPDGLSDPNSVTEKFIPFLIRKINWGVSNKLVNYEFDCAPIGQAIASTTRRGTIPYDVELSASTVGELLGSVVKYSSGATTSATTGPNQTAATQGRTGVNLTNNNAGGGRGSGGAGPGNTPYVAPAETPAVPKANAAPTPKKTVTQGLMGAMNEFQQDLVARKIYEQADVYEIVWANGADKLIRDKSITLPGFTNKKSTPQAQSAEQDPQNLDPDKVAMDISVRNFSITAGQQLLQAIDLAIRNSQYITEQALVKNLENGKTVVNEVAITKPVNWYQISMSAQQLNYDNLRKDYAYKITFTVTPLPLASIDSKYFPVSTFRGIHKSYPYWFTGQNTQVLDFQQQFNAMFNITVSGNDPDHNVAAKFRETYTSSMREIPFYNFQTGSTESRSGAEQNGNEVGANLAEYLYSPNDLARAKIRIIGDPAWIQQGSIFAGVEPASFNFNAFNPDGTINFDSNQIMFEIAWQRPEDYDLSTGIADPYSGGYSGQAVKDRKPVQSNVYQAIKVTSEFRAGRFEQTLEGSLYRFPKPDKSNTVAPTNGQSTDRANQTAATQARTGVNLTNTNAGGGRGGAGGATAAQLKSAASAASNGANSPMISPAPAPTISSSPATTSGGTGNDTLSPAGSSPAPTSNGAAVSSGSNSAPKRLPNNQAANAYLDQQEAAAAQQIAINRERRLAARERSANANAVVDSELSGNPTSPTNAGNQPISKAR